MNENKTELNPESMEKAAGGVNPIYCAHVGKRFTGREKRENGVTLFEYRCPSCGQTSWSSDEPGGGATVGW